MFMSAAGSPLQPTALLALSPAVCVYICIFVYVHALSPAVCMYMYICIVVCIYTYRCIYIYIYTSAV